MISSLHKCTAESEGEKVLKIGQHLPKLWAIKYRMGSFLYETRTVYARPIAAWRMCALLDVNHPESALPTL